jgi:hypothetical protein
LCLQSLVVCPGTLLTAKDPSESLQTTYPPGWVPGLTALSNSTILKTLVSFGGPEGRGPGRSGGVNTTPMFGDFPTSCDPGFIAAGNMIKELYETGNPGWPADNAIV